MGKNLDFYPLKRRDGTLSRAIVYDVVIWARDADGRKFVEVIMLDIHTRKQHRRSGHTEPGEKPGDVIQRLRELDGPRLT